MIVVDTKPVGKLRKRCGKTIKPVHHEFGGARTNSVMPLLSKQMCVFKEKLSPF